MKTKNLFRHRRSFNESFKKARVKEFESGKYSILVLSRRVQCCYCSAYRWIRKYSSYYQGAYRVVVEPKSMSKNNEDLRRRVAELEASLGRKQMEIEFSSEEVGEDLKKSSQPYSRIVPAKQSRAPLENEQSLPTGSHQQASAL